VGRGGIFDAATVAVGERLVATVIVIGGVGQVEHVVVGRRAWCAGVAQAITAWPGVFAVVICITAGLFRVTLVLEQVQDQVGVIRVFVGQIRHGVAVTQLGMALDGVVDRAAQRGGCRQ